jgi:hypothetical protein
VPHLFSQQQLIRLEFEVKTYNPSLNKKLKVQKMNKKQLSTQDSSKVFNRITPLTTSLGVFEREVLTRSHLANFCQYYLFVSLVEPLKVEKALEDED